MLFSLLCSFTLIVAIAESAIYDASRCNPTEALPLSKGKHCRGWERGSEWWIRWKQRLFRQRAAPWHWGAQVATELTRWEVICPRHSCQSCHLIRGRGGKKGRGGEARGKKAGEDGIYVFTDEPSQESSTAVDGSSLKTSNFTQNIKFNILGLVVTSVDFRQENEAKRALKKDVHLAKHQCSL